MCFLHKQADTESVTNRHMDDWGSYPLVSACLGRGHSKPQNCITLFYKMFAMTGVPFDMG